MSATLPPLGIKESVVLGWDFVLNTSEVSNVQLSVAFQGGAPSGSPDPTAILSGGPQIVGAQVLQRIDATAGVVARYLFQCTVDTLQGDTLTLGSVLPIVAIV